MKKALKSLRFILLVIVLLIVAVVVVVNLFADSALKIGIETAATKTLNVGVSIDDLDLSIMGGKLGIYNLIINNPPGYQHDRLLELKQAQIQVDVRSLLKDVVNVKEIRLDGVNLVLEQRGLSNNLQEILKALPAKEDKPTEPSGKKLHIDNLEITNVTVKAKLLPVPGKIDTVTMKLAPIKMTNLGSDNKLDMAALSSKILLAIANGVAEQGVGVLPEDMVGTIKSTLGKTLDIGKAATKEGLKLIDTGKDAGKGLIEGVKGILKPKKEE